MKVNRRYHPILTAMVIIMLLAGCDEADNLLPAGNGTYSEVPYCAIGDSQKCVCYSGEEGTLACAIDGGKWMDCQCGSEDVGTVSDPGFDPDVDKQDNIGTVTNSITDTSADGSVDTSVTNNDETTASTNSVDAAIDKIDTGQANPDTGRANPDCTPGEGTTAHFSFFVTSLEGLRRLSGSEDGFGGDLRFGFEDGLSGADEICRLLAEDSYPGAGCKTWRAFLSATKGPDGKPVHARDRIGEGPWYDRLGRVVAMNKEDLLMPWPVGADPLIMYDLPNEFGVPNHNPDGTGFVDNHNTVTGTGPDGRLFSDDWATTCHDWTSSVGTDGRPIIGFSWMGGAAIMPGTLWFSNVAGVGEGGCAPIINLTNVNNMQIPGIGSSGGYGGFYCLALEP